MEDSFFGFDTSAPVDDRIEEPSEEEYDALNDETFGSAINGDWEEVHENLVRLDGVNGSSTSKNAQTQNDSDVDDTNSDLEFNFSRVRLDDVEIGGDDSESGVTLDPSVWANPLKPIGAGNNSSGQRNLNFFNQSPESFLRQHFSNPFAAVQHQQTQQIQEQQLPRSQHHQSNSLFDVQTPPLNAGKICTLEDIERNIITQQQQQQHQQNQHQRHHMPPAQLHSSNLKAKTPVPQAHVAQLRQIQQQQQQQNMLHSVQNAPPQQQQQQQSLSSQSLLNSIGPPGFNGLRPNFNLPLQHPLGNMCPNPALAASSHNRMPPGFSTLPLLPGHGGNPQLMGNFPRPLQNLPIALNNFAMHPNFNAMRQMGPQHSLPPRMLSVQQMLNQQMPTGMPLTANEFNQRLLQEIQQNHPMLPRGHPMYGNGGNNGNHYPHGHNHNQRQDKQRQGMQNHRSNGNLPDGYDEYSNLMSTRDKHWLISIQLSQLNTDTPYIDDYYYTVFKERKAKLNGETGQSKAHKANQLNHPFSQPTGHAQLVMVQLGNKNGGNNRNGQNNRERKNSESKNNEQQNQQNQLQFENSLGKLQYGSVTAPRKLIDMEVMGTDPNQQLNNTTELSTQRKSRHILLHIETLFRIVLKLEDLQNPAAIATSLILKERKEKEKQQALEQAMIDALNRAKLDNKGESHNASVNTSISDKFTFEFDSRDKLLGKLLPGLTDDKITGIMNVRKGRSLMCRIMPHIRDNQNRWNVWGSIFRSLRNILKRDKDNNDLFALYPEFKEQIQTADFETVVTLAYDTVPPGFQKLFERFSNKFCLSSIVALILQAETIYATNTDVTLTDAYKADWLQYLRLLSISINKTIQNHTISAAIESDAIKPLMDHFARFKDLELEPLLTLFSHPEEQVN